MILLFVFPYGVLGILYGLIVNQLVFFFIQQRAILVYLQINVWATLKPIITTFFLGLILFFMNFYGLHITEASIILEVTVMVILSLSISYLFCKAFLGDLLNDIFGVLKLASLFNKNI